MEASLAVGETRLVAVQTAAETDLHTTITFLHLQKQIITKPILADTIMLHFK